MSQSALPKETGSIPSWILLVSLLVLLAHNAVVTWLLEQFGTTALWVGIAGYACFGVGWFIALLRNARGESPWELSQMVYAILLIFFALVSAGLDVVMWTQIRTPG